ncbi:MAG: hypothetical protein HY301_01655 [Verrucomicrobia bacterium]|nr:hypothetical protein [Verrucomicrobiota bacterium]
MRNWKVILSLVAIFLAGIVTGAVLTVRVVKSVADRNLNPEHWPASLVESYRHRLKLTPDQVENMRPAIEEGRQEWKQAMEQAIRTHVGIMRHLDEQMTPLLTDEQKKVQEQMREELRKKLRERFNLKQLPDS